MDEMPTIAYFRPDSAKDFYVLLFFLFTWHHQQYKEYIQVWRKVFLLFKVLNESIVYRLFANNITACCFVTVQFKFQWKSDEIGTSRIYSRKNVRGCANFFCIYFHTFTFSKHTVSYYKNRYILVTNWPFSSLCGKSMDRLVCFSSISGLQEFQ